MIIDHDHVRVELLLIYTRVRKAKSTTEDHKSRVIYKL